jgi:bifunctional DNA-binding transcriptional regulator/antitoxin component of YhaV-PrlF toxin-antitoxin module
MEEKISFIAKVNMNRAIVIPPAIRKVLGIGHKSMVKVEIEKLEEDQQNARLLEKESLSKEQKT